jgi:dihydroorotate dehydrogenase (fumarate)
MDLSTTWLGLSLPHPLMPGASPLVDDLDAVRRLEDAGAAAIVMHSLFEEQITREQVSGFHATERHAESFAEATSWFPAPAEMVLGPDEYLNQLRRIRAAVSVPVIGSLNGVTRGGWLEYAYLIEQAGADALELNVWHLSVDPDEPAATIEDRTVDVVAAVAATVRIPIAVKLSPHYTAPLHLARRLAAAGARGLVLFNRSVDPEIDVDELDVRPALRLSTSDELAMRLRWLAVMTGRVAASLAVSGGVHEVVDVVRASMAGAQAVQMVSALLRRGPGHLAVVRDELSRWLEAHEYDSLAQLQGSMSLERSPDPSGFLRGNYVRILQSWSSH